jgi:hypothetical protein
MSELLLLLLLLLQLIATIMEGGGGRIRVQGFSKLRLSKLMRRALTNFLALITWSGDTVGGQAFWLVVFPTGYRSEARGYQVAAARRAPP